MEAKQRLAEIESILISYRCGSIKYDSAHILRLKSERVSLVAEVARAKVRLA